MSGDTVRSAACCVHPNGILLASSSLPEAGMVEQMRDECIQDVLVSLLFFLDVLEL